MMRDLDLRAVATAMRSPQDEGEILHKVHDGIGVFVAAPELLGERDEARRERDEARDELSDEKRATGRLATLLHRNLRNCCVCPAWRPGKSTCYADCEQALIRFAHSERPLNVEDRRCD